MWLIGANKLKVRFDQAIGSALNASSCWVYCSHADYGTAVKYDGDAQSYTPPPAHQTLSWEHPLETHRAVPH